MTRHHTQKGFTLVELAVVIVIIGLLIGGMLKGKQLITNARITSTASQVSAIESAVVIFRSTYNGLPGDLLAANTRIPNCTNCFVNAAGVNGNNIIGNPIWNGRNMQSIDITAGTADQQAEAMFFWAELAQADMITGVSYDGSAVALTSVTFGTHMPAAKIGGGFGVAHVSGTVRPGVAPTGASTTYLSGTTLILNPTPTGTIANTTGVNIMDAAAAKQIDTKLDDGQPFTGRTQAFGVTVRGSGPTGCYISGAPYVYNELASSQDCGLAFQIK